LRVPGFKEAGTGEPVVFLHGIGGNRHAFDAQLAELSRRYRCISWDMPGYGGSPPMPEMTFAGLSDVLASLLDHLDLPSAHLVGHSMGGMVAQTFALAEPGRVRSLVLAQTTARFGKPGSDWQQRFLDARLKPLEEGLTPADFARELIMGMFGDPSRTEAIDQAVATMSPLPADVYRQVLTCLVGFDLQGSLAEMRAPTLCLAAELDQTAPPRTMEKMAAEMPAARYHCLPGAGHLAYVETPSAFTLAVDEFLGHLS
jgi:3-oxoadipate enol-lactonase